MADWVDWLAQLHSRLPELDRQLSKFEQFSTYGLPKGLFQGADSFEACMASIRRDMALVQHNPDSALMIHLAKQIHQKVAVLVHICRARGKKKPSLEPSMLTALSTREQWLLECNISQSKLLAQQSALLARLRILDSQRDTAMGLALRAELGEIERELNSLRENNPILFQD